MKLITLTNPTVNFTELALLCDAGDTLLLRQDAVYLAQRYDINWPCQQIAALSSDVKVRNISPVANITTINDNDWVQLAASASQVILWR